MSRSLRINWILKGATLAGGVRTVRQLAEALEHRGHRSTILHLVESQPTPRPWQLRATGRRMARAWRLRGLQQHHLAGTPLPVVAVRGDRIRPEDVPDADVVIGTWWETMEWIRDWPAEKGQPAYYVQHYEVHGNDAERVRATYRQDALKMVVASWLQRLMAEEFGDPTAVLVPNAVDFEQFEAPPRRRQPTPTVGVMTSLKGWKRTDLAFAAVHRAQRAIPELRLLAFGPAPLSGSQRTAAPANLTFHLRPRQSELADLYRACDSWLLTSDLEGFGLPGLEAAACRCPVVATRCGGPEDYVHHGVSGFLEPVGNAAALGLRLLELFRMTESEWQAMSDASHEIARGFTWESSAAIAERALLSYVSGYALARRKAST